MLLAVAAGFGVLFAVRLRLRSRGTRCSTCSRRQPSTRPVRPRRSWSPASWSACPPGAFPQVRLGLQQGYVNSIFIGIGNIAALVFVIFAIQMRLGLPWLVLAMAGAPVVATLVERAGARWLRTPWLRPRCTTSTAPLARSLLRVGLLFLVLQLAVAVAFTSNSIIIAAMIGPSAVADYAVVAKLFLIPTVLVGLALGPLWPAYREALSRGDVGWVRRTFRRSIRLSLSVAGLVSGGARRVRSARSSRSGSGRRRSSRRSGSSWRSASGPRSARSGPPSPCFSTEPRS